MPSLGFTEAAEQLGVGGDDRQQLAAHTTASELLDGGGDALEADAGIARIDADGDGLSRGTFSKYVSHEGLEHRGRKIIDAAIAEVFECVQDDTLARSGQSADQNESQRSGQERNKAGLASVTRPSPFLGMVIRGLFFALLDQTIEFVGEGIDGGVHVFGFRIGMNVAAADFQRGLGAMTKLFDG